MQRVLNSFDLGHAVDNLIRLWAVAATVMLGLILFDDRVATIATGTEPDRHLAVRHLDYRDGMFEQIVVPDNGTGPLHAQWTAGIWTPRNVFICGGQGAAPYAVRSQPARFDPDGWTGDDCGSLQPGQPYQARASWVYETSEGTESVNREFEFVYEPTVLAEDG